MSKVYLENWRVNINYLSQDYEDSALETSSPYKSFDDAQTAYNDALSLFCVDDKSKPVRVSLEHYAWKSKKSMVTHETICKNY